MACGDCGRYLKKTADYTIRADEQVLTAAAAAAVRSFDRWPSLLISPPLLTQPQGRRHPDNDPSIMNCNRCSCPAEAHEAVAHEQVGRTDLVVCVA